MKKPAKKLTPLAIALSAGAAISLTNVTVSADSSGTDASFAVSELNNGYRVQQTSYYERRDGERSKDKKGKEGKCGKDKKGKEGKCGKDKKDKRNNEGKCGAGKCGS